MTFIWSLPNHIPNTFTLSFTSWCICGWLMVSGLPIFAFCSFILDPDTCSKFLNSIRQGCPLSISLYALIIETLASSIRCNNNIRGIHIPNTHKNTTFSNSHPCDKIHRQIYGFQYFSYKKMLHSVESLLLIKGY
jgi:hypothetical protein